jgi:hypothetical protein
VEFDLIPLFISVILFSQAAFAHKMGGSFWCLVFTDTHQECFYDDSSACDTALKKILSFTKLHPTKAPASEKDGTKVELTCLPNPTRQNEFMMGHPSKSFSPKMWNPDQPW